jgi:hypothetical protein
MNVNFHLPSSVLQNRLLFSHGQSFLKYGRFLSEAPAQRQN